MSINPAKSYRAFIGIFPDDKVRSFIRDANRLLVKEARNFRFIPVDQLHITLQFLGSTVSGESLELITTTARKYLDTVDSFELRLNSLNFGFTSQNSPSVMFWDLEPSRELNHLTSNLHTEIKRLGLPDVKQFKDHAKLIHHITTARSKRQLSRNHSKKVKEIISQKITHLATPVFKAQEIVLIESTVIPTGSKYSPIERFMLD